MTNRNSFLEKEPVMSEVERDDIYKLETTPFPEYYGQSTEEKLYTSVKTKRKKDKLPSLNWKPENVDTYNKLVINKYKENSPIGDTISGPGSLDTPTISEDQLNFTPPTFQERAERIGEGAKEVAGAALGDVAGFLDVGLQQFGKAAVGATTGVAALKYNADELIDSIQQDRPFNFLTAGEKTEAIKEDAEWLFGTKLEWGDYFDVRSSDEKRTEMFNGFTAEKQKALKPLENWALAFDITGSLLSGIGMAKAPLSLANKVGKTTELGKSMVALDGALVKIGEQLPKMGAIVGASAFLYYQQTGKWLFEGDRGATEGAGILLGAAGLKGLGKTVNGVWKMSKAGKKYIGDLYSNPKFQEGVRTYFNEVKGQFGEKIDKVAAKVGARSNFVSTSDDALVQRLSDIKVGKEVIKDDVVSKEIEDKLAGALKSGLKKKTLREQYIARGILREDESTFTGIRRAMKMKGIGKFVNVNDEILGELGGDKGVTGFLKAANRPLGTKLDLTRASGQISHVESKLEDVALAARTQLKEFNNYLFAKSRYFKTKDKGVSTKILDGENVKDFSLSEMEEVILKGEKKFSKLANGIYNEFKSLNERELEAGIRSVDDLNNFAKNPFYVGDKELDPEKLLKIGPDNLSSTIPKKFLTKNGEEVLSVNSIDNTFQEIAYRYEALNRVEKINTAIQGLPKDFKQLSKGEKPGIGKLAFNHYKDGELVRMEGPDFWVKSIFGDDRLSQTNRLTALPRYMTRVFKELQTGRMSITTGYPLVAPLLELPPAMIRSAAEWKGGKEFYKSLLSGVTGGKINTGIGKDPRTAKAIEDMAEQFGFTFTHSKQLKREIKETIGKEYTMYNAKKTRFQRGKELGTKVLDWVDIGNVIEKKTIRMPLYMQGLAKQGLTQESANKMLKEANYDVNKFKKILMENGVDPLVAGDAAVNVFDYYGVTKVSREIGSMVPYFNSKMSQAKATKTLFEKNPKLFVASTMGAGYLGADAIYKFNTNTDEKKKAYDEMPAYRKNSPLLYFGKNEEGEEVFMRMMRGVQALEWAYPLYVEAQEKSEGGEFSFDEAFGKMFEDTTGFSPNVKDLFQILPQGLKQSAEIAFDVNFFTHEPRSVKPDAKEYPTQDFNKNTSRAAVGLSRLLAGITIPGTHFEAGELGKDGVIRGGFQVSPFEIDKAIDSFDNGTLRGIIGNLLTDVEQTGKVDKKKLLDVSQHFMSTGIAKKNSQELFDDKGLADAETYIRSNRINSTIRESTPENIKENTKELIDLYPEKAQDIIKKAVNKKKEDKIREKIKSDDPVYANDLIKASSMTNEQIAFIFLGRVDREGNDKAKSFLSDMMKANLIKPTRLVNIINKVVEVKKNRATMGTGE